MSTDHHTPITKGAIANADTVNAPLAELDDAINVEHETDGTHSAGIIDTTELANGAVTNAKLGADAVDGTKIADDAIATEHIADGAIAAQAQVNLGGAAAANGDALRYDEFTVEHNADGTHKYPPSTEVIWSDSSVQASANNDAPALTEYEESTGDGADVIVVRCAWQKTSGYNTLGLRGQYWVEDVVGNISQVILAAGGASDQYQPTVAGAWTDFDQDELSLDVSALSNGTTYVITVTIESVASVYRSTKLRHLALIAYNSGVSPT